MREWRDVQGYEGVYQVSNDGQVRRLSTTDAQGRSYPAHDVKQYINPDTGYMQATFWRHGKGKTFYPHVLVALTFIGERPDQHDVNHINGVKTDNRLENLEFCTKSKNRLHSIDLGLERRRGQDHPLAKLTEKQVAEIRQRLSNGELGKTIAAEFGVSRAQISAIKNNKRWNK